MLHSVILVLAAAFASQTAPAAPQQDPGIVVQGETAKPAKKVCKRAVPTGSVMPKVTCRSAQEWDQQTANAITGIEQLKNEAKIRQQVQNDRELQP